MKIALFTETYLPSVNGVAAHVKTLRDGLEALGHEVLVVMADKHARHHYVEEGVLHCPALEIKRFYGFGAASPISAKRQRLIASFGPDVIHIHHEFGVGLSGIWAARAHKLPLVYTLHTMYDQYIYYIAPRMLLQAATKFAHTYNHMIAKNATALTGPSQKCEEYFREIGIDKNMSLIPNSADLNAFDPARIPPEKRAEIREKFGIPQDAFLACFCGRLGKEKSVDVLIDYFADTIAGDERIYLIIFGDGPDKDALERQVRDRGVEGFVKFSGMVPHKDMPAYFSACDVYVSASLSEMNSISMLEGMATGLPVLQRYDELNADQISSGENGYLYHTKEELAEYLRRLKAMDEKDRKALRGRVIATVTSRGATQLATYILDVYQKAIEEKQTVNTQTTRKRVRVRLR